MGKDFDIEKLKGHSNYHTWCFSMKNLVDYKGYGNCLNTVKDKDSNGMVCAEKEASKLTACKALLSLSVEKNIQTHIESCHSPLAVSQNHKNHKKSREYRGKRKLFNSFLSSTYLPNVLPNRENRTQNM